MRDFLVIARHDERKTTSVQIPMAVGGTTGVAVAQRAIPFAPLDGFDVPIHEGGVDHAIVAGNRQTGVIAPLVIGIFNGWIDELILGNGFAHVNPLLGVEDAERV